MFLNSTCCYCGELVKSPYGTQEEGFREISAHKRCLSSYVQEVKHLAEVNQVNIEDAKRLFKQSHQASTIGSK